MSPTLFYDYYSANDYLIEECIFYQYSRNHDSEPWGLLDYRPGLLDSISFGGLTGDKLYGVWVVAKKKYKFDIVKNTTARIL